MMYIGCDIRAFMFRTPRFTLAIFSAIFLIFIAAVHGQTTPPAKPVAHAKPSAATKPIVAAQLLTLSPPMGWNSWDAYGFTIGEDQFKDNAAILGTMDKNGWQYAVIDEGWYFQNPEADKSALIYDLDANGREVPDAVRFPSAANDVGFKALADWTHSFGLKFGIHILRGIPRLAVTQNLPIADSNFHANDAADTSDTCSWDAGNYGVRDNAAGQAYYDSIMKLYASWGVDFVKVDCISNPYKADEIRMIAAAIKNSGRPIVLSLSPGPTSLEHAAEVGKYSEMWRIANDTWDGWDFVPTHEWPNGVLSAFDNLEKWQPYVKPGNWPDADMLPWGSLTPHPGWGAPRQSRLTPDEERTQLTLWAISRSPIILGGNLTKMDRTTRALVGNAWVLDMNQEIYESHPVKDLPTGFEKARVWVGSQTNFEGLTEYVAVFNLDDQPATLHASWKQLGVSEPTTGMVKILDLFDPQLANNSPAPVATPEPVDQGKDFKLPAHGSLLYRVELGKAPAERMTDNKSGAGCDPWCQ
jgi:hypothetical protein